ncbi:hypothetical protein FISHEDRAFT_36877 [Fistulina hepatica ATCC 64428]|uniref:Complex 1 LYR protein n=1 Tax=Fistulina hepatica ATCC 64428 TaxID=1128425 RepID=A0A0D7AIA8_9AGAR|nr:hypothetical protein FISHEDRAFT_36877 [Fistulina hepatica ATCC 64428]
MELTRVQTYRAILRELCKSVKNGKRRLNATLRNHYRSLFDQYKKTDSDKHKALDQDLSNAFLFLRSQRQYKELLDRYNPLIDFTAEERIEATARRVGLNMPITHKLESSEGQS